MRLHAVIVTENSAEGNTMSHSRHKGKQKVKTRSEYDRNRMFHSTEQRQGGVTQTTTVTVTVQPEKDGCMTGCMDSVKSCFGLGAKAASGAV